MPNLQQSIEQRKLSIHKAIFVDVRTAYGDDVLDAIAVLRLNMDFLFSAGLLVLLGIFLTNVLDRRQKEQYSAMLQEQRTSFCLNLRYEDKFARFRTSTMFSNPNNPAPQVMYCQETRVAPTKSLAVNFCPCVLPAYSL